MSRARFVVASLVAAACGAAAALGCGIAGGWRWWDVSGGDDFTTLPAARFRDELSRAAPATITDRREPWESRAATSATADAADVVDALIAAGTSRSAARCVAGRVVRWRNGVEEHARLVALSRAERSSAKTSPRLRRIEIPRGLPEEFALYLRGHLAWADGDVRAARRAWNDVLALPEYERHWRSTWAAYRLGRSFVGEDAERASREFTRCRDLADDGFADTDGLARASLGWEARAWFLVGDFARAMRLYIEQREAGVDTTRSLATVADVAITSEATDLRALAGDAAVRRVLTAFVVSRGDANYWSRGLTNEFLARWLESVESAGAPTDDAVRLAWIAYSAGKFDVAERWIARAAPGSPGAAWIASKLRLREGRLDEAAALVAEAMRVCEGRATNAPDDPLANDGSASGPLVQGVVDLCRGRYVESLDVLLRAERFEDAVYVAERVLTTDEFRDYVDRRFPDDGAADAPPPADSDAEIAWSPRRLRLVLARRLVRDGRRADARPYLPSNLRPVLDAFDTALRAAEDATQTADARAAAFRDAARLARDRGRDLLATENEPDLAGWVVRMPSPPSNTRIEACSPTGLEPRPDERARYAASAPRDGRFVLTATRLAWSAAELMPGESDTTAAWLSDAASWLGPDDGDEVARFRESLLARCGDTDLGREVARIGRFPWQKSPAPEPAASTDETPSDPLPK